LDDFSFIQKKLKISKLELKYWKSKKRNSFF